MDQCGSAEYTKNTKAKIVTKSLVTISLFENSSPSNLAKLSNVIYMAYRRALGLYHTLGKDVLEDECP